MSRSEIIRSYGALVLAVLFWGFSFVATKVALKSFSVFSLIFLRFGIASLIYLFFLRKIGFPRFSKREHIRMLVLALGEPVLYFIFETYGLMYTSSIKTALIISTIPVFVLFSGILFLKERFFYHRLLGILLSFFGILILMTGDSDGGLQFKGFLLGDLLVFGAVISATIYIICMRELGKKYPSAQITVVQTFYGALFFTPLFMMDLSGFDPSMITRDGVVALIYLTFFATILAFMFNNYALSKIEASKAAVFINGIPVVTIFGAWVILGETLNIVQSVGAVITIIGVLFTNISDRWRFAAQHVFFRRRIRSTP